MSEPREISSLWPSALVIPHVKESIMLGWGVTFLLIALAAAVLGFGGLAGTAVGLAKICFFVFLVLAIISLIGGRRIRV
jgi:uncharacterized membrane protein YtjA (UPF0391 family)